MPAAGCSGTMSVEDADGSADPIVDESDVQVDEAPSEPVETLDPVMEDPAELLPDPSDTIPDPDAPVDAVEDEGGGACVRGGEPVDFVCSEGDPVRLVEVPLAPGVDYRRASITFEFMPTDWQGGCYNPYYDPPRWVAVFNYVVELRRGTHWCRGGNIFNLTLRGPDDNQVWFDTYYKDHVAADCSTYTEHRILDPRPGQNLALDEFHAVSIVYDTVSESAVLDFDSGALHFTGTTLPEAHIVTDGSHAFHIVFGLDGFFECYNEAGEEDPAAACCHVPPVGWRFRNLVYEFCP
jgi:hypothetical protein